ncbi:DNA polymerase III subunit chi [Nitrogeniibacter mangrovi]|uniref:DNA polymerase III subunit chi n=1 Tax=Nitrogeniibacter mangrovi TaxID=2016596 RepID=A0A6C1B143_9RHOO|nr:DNA polymerase III subunit chi [Nitrogeniibacter mangrovi]QID17287.1 DNA polymerase III subunit chi [Nitrogeniibacter mangrovi]
MTEVHFYHDAADLAGVACHLTAKAFNAGRRVTVLLPDDTLARQLDQMLWVRQPGSFLPHVGLHSPLAAETPITLGTSVPDTGWTQDDVLINLCDAVPPDFAQFKMIVEVVGQDDRQRGPARARWKHYAAAGLPPQAHNVKGEGR